YLFGETGIGKTHLALSIASEVLKKQFNVVYVSSQNIFFAMQHDRAEAANIIETLLAADLLILDDLGTELVNAYVISTLYNIVDTRMGRKRPTIYTTNIIDEALLTARYTEKISSRLLGSCEMYRLLGDDIRLQS
ncbi:MAG: ATP-binding protein, partial [Pygmaiobacter massiliensis]|nr:ATP-binding protein [Pygmaiobacter massiliensis]